MNGVPQALLVGGVPAIPPQAIRVPTDSDYVILPSVDSIASYTVTGWSRILNNAFRCPFAESGNTLFPQESLDLVFLYPGSGFQVGGGNTGYAGANLPDLDRWFFWSITNNAGVVTGRWCYLEDTSFDAGNTASGNSTSYVHTPDTCVVGIYGDSGGLAFSLAGDFAQVRRWKAALNTAELLAEKNSPTAVRSLNLWSSNPFRGAADMSDESGNGRVGVAQGAPVDVLDGPGN
jgi:hypothetical protein